MAGEILLYSDIDPYAVSRIKRNNLPDLYSVDKPYPFPHSIRPHSALLTMDEDSMQLEVPHLGSIRWTYQIGGDVSIIVSAQGTRTQLNYVRMFRDNPVRSCCGTFRKDQSVIPLPISNNVPTSEVVARKYDFELIGGNHLGFDVQDDHLFRHGELAPFNNGTLQLSFDVVGPHSPHMMYDLRFPHFLDVTPTEYMTTLDYWHSAQSNMQEAQRSRDPKLRRDLLSEALDSSDRFMARLFMMDAYPVREISDK